MKFELSKKEKEICRYILEINGRVSRDEIAERFKVTVFTAFTHLNNIYTKLAVHSKSELVYQLLTDKTLLEE